MTSFQLVRALTLTLLASSLSHAQSPAPPYNPSETFAPLTLPNPVNAYRSSNGAPGPRYWQNRADYELHATIDTATKTLTGTEVITYTNNSPDTLTSLWLNLEQNIYRSDSRSKAFMPDAYAKYFGKGTTEGYTFDSIQIQPGPLSKEPMHVEAHTLISDTRAQIQLPAPAPLKPGGTLRLLVRYHYTIPGSFGGRTSWGAAKQGEIYDIAQWYPRMCVYDDLHGWDTQPYLGNEFYLEYGTFDYSVTLPANMLVAGSGELVNTKEVLSSAELSRLAEARKSDKTIMIRTADEAAAAAAAHPSTTKTWRFHMENTRDVSFSASAAFLWDAARINIVAGDGKPARAALAQSVYPVESVGPNAWSRSTEIIKDAVENFSKRWYPYPYPNAINVAGPTEGMEYPGIIFDGPDETGVVLFFVGAHEIGHTWFPMIVGSNERRDAWIDEGFNTFIDTFESDDFDHGLYSPKRDSEYAPDTKIAPADQMAKILADPEAPILLTRADAIPETYRHPITYFKSAFGLTLLREDILGPERFDHAFRKFIADWAFKHPTPSDFFRAMESEGGEDLSYFWRGWYFHNWQLDLAVTDLTYDAATHTASVTVANRGRLVLPATLRVETEGGAHVDVAVPAETWMQNTSHAFSVTTTATPVAATIDPDHKLPDADRSNNVQAVK